MRNAGTKVLNFSFPSVPEPQGITNRFFDPPGGGKPRA
jgi:hypothetical protein